MIAQVKIDEVQRLLAAGRFSQREIARAVNISRAVVGQIAKGERPDYEAMRRARGEGDLLPRGPVARCPGCGHRMHMPCHLCHVRALKEQEHETLRQARVKARAAAFRQLLEMLRNPPPRTGKNDPPLRRVG